jgi:hypothetical protein
VNLRRKNKMNLIKKLFVYTVIFSTVLTLSGFSFNVTSAANLSAGMLVKRPDMSAVYYLYMDGAQMMRGVFANDKTYSTWFPDFSGVVTITADELGNIPMGKNIVYRPGTRLIKITTDPKVYAVEEGGMLRWIDSEATAKNLYGNNWASWIDDVPDAFYAGNYNSSNAVSNKITTTHPAGTLIKYASSNSIYYVVGNGTKRLVTAAGFTANKFNEDFVIEGVADTVSYTNGTDITTSEAGLFPIAQGGSTTPISTGTLTVTALGTPAGRSIIADTTTDVGEAMINFLDMNFTASADGNVIVKTLKFVRSGISSDADLDNLYLYEGSKRVAEGGTLSSGIVTLNNSNGMFTIPAGTSKTISLKGDLNYEATAGKTIAFKLNSAADVITGGTVSGSFPINGNLMTVAVVGDLGKVTIGGNVSTTAPATVTTSINSDQTDAEVWNFTLTSGNQPLSIEKLILTEVGSIQVGDLNNFKLFAGGNQVATAEMATDYTVTFDMTAAPVTITKGGSKQFSLRADVIKGSTKTFYFSIQNSTDVIAKDTNYNVYVMPYTLGSWNSYKATASYGFTIASGTVSVNKSITSPTANIAIDSTNVLLAKYDFKANGEDMKIQNLIVQADTSVANGGLDNGQVLVDGVQVGSTKDLLETGTTFTFGSSFVIPAGTTRVVTIVADAKTATSAALVAQTVLVTLNIGASNGQGMSSLQTVNVPTAAKGANTLTFASSALTISKYSGYGSQTFVSGPAKMGSFVISAGASSAINLSSITVALSASEYASISDLYITRHDTGVQYGATKNTPGSSNIFNSNVTIPASGAIIFDLYANINSNADAGTWIANIDAEGTSNNGASSVGATAMDIQTITIGTGSLVGTNGSHPSGDILLAGSANNLMADFSFSATGDSYTIDEILLNIGSIIATSTASVSIEYKDVNNVTQTQTGIFASSTSGVYYANFTNMTMYVKKGQDTSLKVRVTFSLTEDGAVSGASGAIVLYSATNFHAIGSSGANTDFGDDLTANTFYLRKSKPTLAKLTQDIAVGSPQSDQPLFRFSVVADAAGQVDFKQFGFVISTSGVTVSAIKLYDNNGNALTDTGVNADGSGYVKLLVGGVDNDVESMSTTAKTYYVAGTLSGWGQQYDSIDVSFKSDTGAATNAGANTQAGSYYNVWTDRSGVNGSHTTATADWTNGHLVKSFTGGWSFSK